MFKPPPCLCASFFLSPCIVRLGNRWSSFEPITQPDPLIITNLPESLIWGLPNSALCTMWLFVSVLLLFFFFFSRCRCKGGKSKEKEKERDREGVRERDCLCAFAHLSLGIFHQSEIRQVCGWVSILGTQWTTHKGFIFSYLLPTPFQGILSLLSVRVLLISQSHMGLGTCCLVNYTVGGLGQLKGLRMSPINNAVAYHCGEYITQPRRYMAAYQTLQVKQ